jgi:hypothetical protein
VRRRGTVHVARPLCRTTVHTEHLTFSTIVHRSFSISFLAFLVTGDDRRTTAYRHRAAITDCEPPPL